MFMFIYEFNGQWIFAVFWGFCLIVSFVGYGWLLARLLKIPLNPSPLAELGLYTGWGLSLWIAAGGILVFSSLVSSQLVISLMLGGLSLFIYALFKHSYKGQFLHLGGLTGILWLLLIITALTLYISHSTNFLYNPNDDMVIYHVFPQQMLQTGTLIDPFSWRRMTAYGGQSFMQAACMCVLPPEYMNLFDRGICMLLSFIILANIIWSKKLEKSLAALLLLAVMLVIPLPAVNESSEGSALFLILVLVATCEKLSILNVNMMRSCLILGLVSSAYYTLKSQHLIGLVFFFGFFYFCEIFRTKQLVPSVKKLFWILLFTICLLLPWARVQFLSNGTFLYPIFHGNQPLDFAPASLSKSMLWNIKWVLNYILSSPVLLICLLAMALVNEIAERKVIASLCLAAVAQFLVVGYIMAPNADQEVAVYRYVFGMIISAVLLALLSAIESSKRSEELRCSNDNPNKWNHIAITKRLIPFVLAALLLFNTRDVLRDLFKVQLTGLINYSPGPWVDKFNQYRMMQDAVPPGEPILVYTNFPFLFDFRRNPIYTGDIPGGCSPPPYLPFFKGADSLKKYLNGLGINYIIHSDFNAPGQITSGKYELYSKPFWIQMSQSPYEVWQAHAPYFLDMMNNLDSLEKKRNANAIRHSDLTLFSLKEKPDEVER